MKTMRTAVAAAMLAAGACGCACFNETSVAYSRTTSMGRELVDLKEAKDKGLLSEEEYAKARKEILEAVGAQIQIPAKP
jgi:hypothetical protein